MLPATLTAICLILACLLIRERIRQRREFARLELAIRKQDRRLLGSDDYARAPSHIRSLERAIFDQLFTAASLEESVTRREKLLASLVDGLGDAVLITDRKNRIRFANERARELFELPADISGTPVREALTQSQLLTWLGSCHDSAESSRTTIAMASHLLGGDKDRTFEVDIAPLQLNELGGADVSRIVLHDITERVELERVRKDFVANASHELRTPLTIINGYLENLLEDDALEEPATSRRFLTVMQKHGNRLTRIVEDMLTISKLESDDPDVVNTEGFNFAACAREVADRLSPMIEKKSAKVRIEVPLDQEILHGDPFYWDQILFNLMENAIKENDHPGLQLTVSKSDTPTETIITVNDDGVGIPKSALPFIFKRFYRVDESHASEKTGTGLGLSIVMRAIEAQNGTIEVASTPGKATTFTIHIPREPDPSQAD